MVNFYARLQPKFARLCGYDLRPAGVFRLAVPKPRNHFFVRDRIGVVYASRLHKWVTVARSTLERRGVTVGVCEFFGIQLRVAKLLCRED